MQKLLAKFIFAMLMTLSATTAFAQISPPDLRRIPRPVVKPAPPFTTVPQTPPYYDGETSEKVIAVDQKVNVSLCLTQGNVTVNGSMRNEVRIFVRNGSKFAFNVQETNVKTGKPAWIALTSTGDKNPKYGTSTECIWGDQIEIEVPQESTVTIKGREITARLDTIRRANVRSVGGSMNFRNISGGISASAGQGDIMVENSQGAMSLESTTGNVIVFEASPAESGDILRARTNSGAISLQKTAYRQIDVNSVSGSVVFNGEVLRGAIYGFSTTSGSIRLSLPKDSSCKVAASYGFGAFESKLPLKVLTENLSPGSVKSINGTFGSGGDGLLKITTSLGSISIINQ